MFESPRRLGLGRWQSGQMQQSVKLSPYGYAGSNPARPTRLASQLLSKLARGKPPNYISKIILTKRVECPERSRRAYAFMYFVYMIKNFSNQLYVGVTKNLEDRLDYHNNKRGALFTQNGNYKIVFHEEYSNLADARKREIQIKKWRRDKKELLIEKFDKGLPTKI